MNNKIYEFKAIIEAVPDVNGALCAFSLWYKKEFGKGQSKRYMQRLMV